MPRTLAVEIDSSGRIHPVIPGSPIPKGRAILTWPEPEEDESLLLAEPALSDWLRPEEDEAWAHLQPVK